MDLIPCQIESESEGESWSLSRKMDLEFESLHLPSDPLYGVLYQDTVSTSAQALKAKVTI